MAKRFLFEREFSRLLLVTKIFIINQHIDIFCVFKYSIFKHFLHGPVFRKSRKRFGSKQPFVKLRPTYSVKLVYAYLAKGIKMKVSAKFRSLRHLSFEDTKRIGSEKFLNFRRNGPQ